jgi:kynurenine formamidase
LEQFADLVAETAKRCRNWGRWGEDDRIGTLNFIDDGCRARAAALVRRGRQIPLAIQINSNGPQRGHMGRINPIHTFTATGADHVANLSGATHGIGGTDDVIFMHLQAATHWDGLGHILDRGFAYNGRPADQVVTARGDRYTGIEQASPRIVGRGLLLDVGRVFGNDSGVLADGFAITEEHIRATIERQGSPVQRGDIVLVRTGNLGDARRRNWEHFATGPAPGLSFQLADWLYRSEIAALAIDNWGTDVNPPEVPGALVPLHQVAVTNIGLTLGELWDLDALAEDCAETASYESLLVASPLPITGAVGGPVSPIALR